ICLLMRSSPRDAVGIDRRCQRVLVGGPWPYAIRDPAGAPDSASSADLDAGEHVQGVLSAAVRPRAVVRGLVPPAVRGPTHRRPRVGQPLRFSLLWPYSDCWACGSLKLLAPTSMT